MTTGANLCAGYTVIGLSVSRVLCANEIAVTDVTANRMAVNKDNLDFMN